MSGGMDRDPLEYRGEALVTVDPLADIKKSVVKEALLDKKVQIDSKIEQLNKELKILLEKQKSINELVAKLGV